MATSLGIGGQIVTDGLVLCLDALNPLSYEGSGIYWNDLSGQDNHATLIGSNSEVHTYYGKYFTSDPLGYYGASSSGTSGQTTSGSYWDILYDTSLSPTSTGQWTVSGFMNVNGEQTGNGVGWFHKQGTGDERGIHIEPISNSIRVNGASGWSNPSISISSYFNQWKMYTVTYKTTGTYGVDTGTLNVYIDDTLVTTNSSFRPAADTTSNIWLGRRNGHNRHYLKGSTANYLYYLRELTIGEIREIYRTFRARYNQL